MDFHLNHHNLAGGSPSSSTSSSDPNHSSSLHRHRNGGENPDPMHSWWESISKARSRIQLLSTLLPENPDSPPFSPPLSSLADSDHPAHSLLSSCSAYSSISSSLSSPSSGSGDDPLCHWLYDTFLSSDPDLRLVVLSFIPLISSLYLARIHSSSPTAAPSLAGFEAVLLALYASETKSRAGKPITVSIPDLSQPSLYHTPRINANANKSNPNANKSNQSRPSIGVLCPPLEPQTAVKSTKRACIIGVALDCYYKQISQMPSWSKYDFCRFAADWAGQDCPCKSEFDPPDRNHEYDHDINTNGFSESTRILEIEDAGEEMRKLEINGNSEDSISKGVRIPLPWELLQPALRILGHCLLGPLNSQEVKDAASMAVRCLYARASHELFPQAILATSSLIKLDNRARETAKTAAATNAASNTNTPTKAKKPEILLASK